MAERESYDRIAQLIRTYQTGGLDTAEEAELRAWRTSSSENQRVFEELNSPSELAKAVKEMASFDATGSLAEFEHKYLKDNPAIRLWQSWKTIAAAMVAAAVIGTGIWYYKNPVGKEVSRGNIAHKNDVNPGKNIAVLTLSSGEVINLDTNKTSVVVTDSVKTMVMLTASTPRGGTYQVTLPDGSQVWLNADTKITFPSIFTGTKREVNLEGEAYFSVSHNKQKPFIVKTADQEVAVLGTEFNINAYKDENKTLTTLLNGSVRINASTQATLLPGQQSSLTNGQLKVQKADTESATSWKNGIFLFYNQDMKSIMRQLSRWYDVEIDMTTIPESRYYGEISRDVKLSEVLTMLEATGNIKFKIEGRRVMLLK